MHNHAPRLFVVMGVCGCGKSSIGKALAQTFDGIYIEGDDLHPSANVDLMSAGTPLTDEDRWPWLENIARTMASTNGPAFAACSALKKSYRSFMVEKAKEPIQFIHLNGSKEIIADRMRKREDHFMPTALLDSQFDTLEPPSPAEGALVIDISGSVLNTIQSSVAAVQPIIRSRK